MRDKHNIQVVTNRETKDYESSAPVTGGGRGIITTRIKTRKRDYLRRIIEQNKGKK